MEKLAIGEINLLKVVRKTDIGYMLENSLHEEVFLHNNETNYLNIKAGQMVKAFLFFDNKARLAATLYEPILTLNQVGFLKVTGINSKLGVFLDNGIKKDILLSKDHLMKNQNMWPQIGDQLFVKIILKNRLLAEFTYPKSKPLEDLEIGQSYLGIIQKIEMAGIKILTYDLHEVFVNENLLRGKYRLGQEVEVKITFETNTGYSGSLIANKEIIMIDDAKLIYDYLVKHKKVSLTSESSPEAIKEVFNLSKKAFKRAIGHLYKERIIDFVDDKTILIGELK